MSCSTLEVSRRFGGICRLHLHRWRIGQARNQRDARGKQSHISQKRELSVTTSVRTSRPTCHEIVLLQLLRPRNILSKSIMAHNCCSWMPSDRNTQWVEGSGSFTFWPWRPVELWEVEAPTFSIQSAHRWRWGYQPYAPAALYPPGIFLVLNSVRGWVDRRAIVRLEVLGQLKNPITSSGLKPATFRLVAYIVPLLWVLWTSIVILKILISGFRPIYALHPSKYENIMLWCWKNISPDFLRTNAIYKGFVSPCFTGCIETIRNFI
jgi:hypothetical protein